MKLIIILLTLFFISASFPQEIKEKENSLLTYAQTKMSINNYVDMVRALEIGERYFNIDKDIVLAVLYIESDFKVNAKSELNDNGTFDYGLSEQNEIYILERYKLVSKILDKEKISYDINNPYDIYLNVLACYYYLDHCIELKGSKSQGIKKYNGTGKRAELYMYKVIDTYFKNV